MSNFEEFWARQEDVKSLGCLPNRDAQLDGQLRGLWVELATQLPEEGQVLDLCTGDGLAIVLMQEHRSDCEFVGVDLAKNLPSDGQNARFIPGINIEKLPFSDDQFCAITSQFGIEYSNLDRSAAEFLRVLKPAGQFRFLMHHQSSAIAQNSAARAHQLEWVLTGEEVPQKAIQQAEQLVGGPAANIGREAIAPFEALARQAHSMFGQASVALEICVAVLQILAAQQPPAPGLASENWRQNELRQLQRFAQTEHSLLQAMLSAAMDDEQFSEFGALLASNGAELTRCDAFLYGERGPQIGTVVSGTKR